MTMEEAVETKEKMELIRKEEVLWKLLKLLG
jgi:hypothetical protein